MRLKGKVAIITCGGSGQGRGMSRAARTSRASRRAAAIAPGIIMTPTVASIPQKFLDASADYQKMLRAPAERAGQPDEIPTVVAFLASDDVSFIHGSTLAVDGGYSVF